MKHLTLIIVLLTFLSCSKDETEIIEPSCECQVKTTVVKLIWENGLPKTRVYYTYQPYVNDCNLDGLKLGNNQTVECK